MALVQVSCREGQARFVKEGERPVIELNLEPHQRVVDFELMKEWQHRRRKTVDWRWRAFVATYLDEQLTPDG